MKLGFIGLGVMGFPMAGHLQRGGHDVCVFNRTPAKAELWCQRYGGRLVQSPADCALNSDIVLSCVGNDDDVREVLTGSDGALSKMRTGSLLVDHTTTSPGLAKALAELAAQAGVGFVDAPVSGGQIGAEQGTLTVMCGGDASHFAVAEPVIRHYAKKIARLGEVGAGQLTKAVNQICLAGLIEGLAEGLHFAERGGLDRQAVIDVISQGAAQSWQMDQRHQTMIDDDYDHGFAVDWMVKDLGIALAAAQDRGLTLPVTELVAGYYRDIQTMGGGRWDTSSLLRRLQTSP